MTLKWAQQRKGRWAVGWSPWHAEWSWEPGLFSFQEKANSDLSGDAAQQGSRMMESHSPWWCTARRWWVIDTGTGKRSQCRWSATRTAYPADSYSSLKVFKTWLNKIMSHCLRLSQILAGIGWDNLKKLCSYSIIPAFEHATLSETAVF